MIVRKFFTAPWQVLGSFLGGCWNVIEKLFASSWEVTGNSWRRLLWSSCKVLSGHWEALGRAFSEFGLAPVVPGVEGGRGVRVGYR